MDFQHKITYARIVSIGDKVRDWLCAAVYTNSQYFGAIELFANKNKPLRMHIRFNFIDIEPENGGENLDALY